MRAVCLLRILALLLQHVAELSRIVADQHQRRSTAEREALATATEANLVDFQTRFVPKYRIPVERRHP